MLLYCAQYAWSMAPRVADISFKACAEFADGVFAASIKMSIFLSFAGVGVKGIDDCRWAGVIEGWEMGSWVRGMDAWQGTGVSCRPGRPWTGGRLGAKPFTAGPLTAKPLTVTA